jgi:hypothetical protein
MSRLSTIKHAQELYTSTGGSEYKQGEARKGMLATITRGEESLAGVDRIAGSMARARLEEFDRLIAQGKSTPAAVTAPAAAAAAPIAQPTNAETITAGEVGTYGLNATKKKSASRGRVSTILGELGAAAETLGG